MLRCVGVILLLILASRLVESVFSEKVFGTLHETVSLPCSVNCTSGVLVWSTIQKPDEVLARCNGSSCSSEKGFHLPAEQYLKGNFSLMLLKADYERQRRYTAKCDSETICEVVFTLSPLQITRVINPGDPIDVHIPPADSVEVSFTGNDSEKPSALQVCTIKGEKMQCSSDYKQRASRTITLKIKDGNGTDAGNYTVRDTLNEQITAIVNVQVREKSYAGCKQENILPVWWIVLIVVLSLIIAVLIVVIIYLVKRNQQLQREPAANGHPPQSNGTASYTAGEEQVMLT